MDDKSNLCLICHIAIQPSWYFCPNCGRALKEKAPDISFWKQAYIYAVSLFLTPFGLVWGLKYFRSSDEKTRRVGMISIALTVIGIVAVIWVSKGLIDQYSRLLNNISNQNGNYNLGNFGL